MAASSEATGATVLDPAMVRVVELTSAFALLKNGLPNVLVAYTLDTAAAAENAIIASTITAILFVMYFFNFFSFSLNRFSERLLVQA